MIWFSGLRGAIAFALALMVPTAAHPEILTTTLIIVVFTVLVLGGLTVPVLKCLGIEMGKDEEELNDNVAFARSNRFWRFDRTILIPFFTRKPKLEIDEEAEGYISGEAVDLETDTSSEISDNADPKKSSGSTSYSS